MNEAAFFDAIRADLFSGGLTQSQVDGLNAIIEAWKGYDIRFGAYGLATAYHETNRTMQPIHELGGASYFTRMYDIRGERPQVAKRLGNIYPGDGALFHGRGYVQLTGRDLYARMSELVEADLVKNPDLALDDKIAANIMVQGMTKGLFTGRTLHHYFDQTTSDAFNARRIINGLDRAKMIEGYYVRFLGALKRSV